MQRFIGNLCVNVHRHLNAGMSQHRLKMLWRNGVALNGAACETVSQYVWRQMRKQQRQSVFLIGGFRFRFVVAVPKGAFGSAPCGNRPASGADDGAGNAPADARPAPCRSAAFSAQRRLEALCKIWYHHTIKPNTTGCHRVFAGCAAPSQEKERKVWDGKNAGAQPGR